MFARASFALLLTLAACAGNADSETPVDASTPSDADNALNLVKRVTCPAKVALTITTNATDYVYMDPPTIAVNDVVHFRLASIHNVTPSKDLPSDPGLAINFGGDVCLKFTIAGSFNFFCAVHGFTGAITVL